MATSLGTEPTTSDTGDSQTGTPTTTQNSGMSATMTGTDSTPDTGTSTDPTATATDTGATQGTSATGTTGAVCEPDQLCGFDCCGAATSCVTTASACPTAAARRRAASPRSAAPEGDLCYLGECVTSWRGLRRAGVRDQAGPQQLRRGLRVRPVAQAVPADEGRPRPVSTSRRLNRVQAGAAVHVGQAQGDRLRQGPRLSGRRAVHQQGVHADLEALGPRRRRHADPLPGLVDPAGRRPRRQLRPDIVFNTYTGTSDHDQRGDPGDPRRHRREALDRHRPGLPHQQHLEPAVGDIDLDGKPEVVVGRATASTWSRSKSDGTPLWKSDPFTGGETAAAPWRSPTWTTRAPRRSSSAPPSTTTSARSSGRAPPASASTARAPSPASPTSTPTGDPSSSADAPPTRPPA
jgi:hypothetical protein